MNALKILTDVTRPQQTASTKTDIINAIASEDSSSSTTTCANVRLNTAILPFLLKFLRRRMSIMSEIYLKLLGGYVPLSRAYSTHILVSNLNVIEN